MHENTLRRLPGGLPALLAGRANLELSRDRLPEAMFLAGTQPCSSIHMLQAHPHRPLPLRPAILTNYHPVVPRIPIKPAAGLRVIFLPVRAHLVVPRHRSAVQVAVQVPPRRRVLQPHRRPALHRLATGALRRLVCALDQPVRVDVAGVREGRDRLLARARAVRNLVRVQPEARRQVLQLDRRAVRDDLGRHGIRTRASYGERYQRGRGGGQRQTWRADHAGRHCG